MKKTTFVLSALALMALGTACKNSGFKKTQSGLLYKIIPDGKGPLVKRGDVIKLHFVHKLGDSVLRNSRDQMPYYAKVDSVGLTYDPQEIFPLLHKGDSAVVISLADSLARRQGGLPDFIKPNDKLVLTMRIIDVFTSDSVAQADQTKEMTDAQARQQKKLEDLRGPKTKELEDYLIKNKLQYQKGAQGTFVVIKDPGNGVQADSGKFVSVRYTGKLFPGLKEFESNTYDLQIGAHSVIPGWEEGLQYFKKGGKGTLYIPFYMAYGPRPGPGGQPYENLVFDVEVLDVSDTPKAAAPPGPAPLPNK